MLAWLAAAGKRKCYRQWTNNAENKVNYKRQHLSNGSCNCSTFNSHWGLLSYLEHVRADVNLGLVANLCKVLIITVESRVELHEAVYEETLRVQIETILDLIFEA